MNRGLRARGGYTAVLAKRRRSVMVMEARRREHQVACSAWVMEKCKVESCGSGEWTVVDVGHYWE